MQYNAVNLAKMFDTEVSYTGDDDSSSDGSGKSTLSTPAVVGIVVAIVIIVGIVIGLSIAFLRRPHSPPLERTPVVLATPVSEDTLNSPLYMNPIYHSRDTNRVQL